MTRWINTQLSILFMQIEMEVVHLPLDFRTAQWKTWYMHPFPLAIHSLWKDDSYITASQNFDANTWQCSNVFFFFLFHSTAEIRDPTDITEFTLFPLLPVLSCCYPLKARYDPQTHQTHFVVIFNIKYPFRDYLMLLCVSSPPPPTQLSLNARQIEHF